MAREDVHQLYKEITREVNSLSTDLAKGLGALRYATETNRGNAEELKTEVRARFDRLQDMISKLERAEAANEVRLKALEEANRDHTGKISVLAIEEARGSAVVADRKGQWTLWASLATGILALIGTIAQAFLKN